MKLVNWILLWCSFDSKREREREREREFTFMQIAQVVFLFHPNLDANIIYTNDRIDIKFKHLCSKSGINVHYDCTCIHRSIVSKLIWPNINVCSAANKVNYHWLIGNLSRATDQSCNAAAYTHKMDCLPSNRDNIIPLQMTSVMTSNSLLARSNEYSL